MKLINTELKKIAIKFKMLYNGESHDTNEFMFIHHFLYSSASPELDQFGDTEEIEGPFGDGEPYPDDPIGYNFFSTFFPDLIILLIYLRKYFPKSNFFKTSGFKKELSEYGKLRNKKAHLYNEGLKLKEQQKHIDSAIAIIKCAKESAVLAERMQEIALDINTQMLANYPFLKSKHLIHGNNGFFHAWNYSNNYIGLAGSISKKFKTPNEYIINLIKSIPKIIIETKFDELINIIRNDKPIIATANIDNLILYALSKLPYRSICSNKLNYLNYDTNNTNIGINNNRLRKWAPEAIKRAYIPSLDLRYYKDFDCMSDFNQDLLKYYSNYNKEPFIIDDLNTMRQSWDMVILDLRKDSMLLKRNFYKDFFGQSKGYLFIVSNKHRDIIRREIIKLGEIQSIISFKNNSLLTITKSKQILPPDIEIINAKNYSNTQTGINYKKLIKDIYKKKENVYKSLKYGDFMKEKSLNINRFFRPEFEGSKLSKYCERITTIGKPYNKQYVLKIRDLNELPNSINHKILNKSNEVDLRQRFIKISESCLLIAKSGHELMPTIFKYSGTSVFVSRSILVLKVNEELVTPEFIQYELISKHIKNQLEYIKRGSVIPFYSINDLMQLKIIIPEDENSQDRIVREKREEFFEKSKFKNIINSLIESRNNDRFEKLAALSHAMGTPVINMREHIELSIELLESFEDKEINKRLNSDKLNIKKRLLSVIENIEQINHLRKQFKSGLIFTEKNYPLKIISCTNFCKLTKKILSNSKTELFNKSIELKIDDFELKSITKISDYYKNYGIRINENAYKIFVQEFFTNTKKHAGFKKLNSKENKLKFMLKFSGNNMVLNIMNNGRPFHEDFDKKKFIAFGQTTNMDKGDGIGGSKIEAIANLIRVENWDIVSDENYNVIFSFNFVLENLLDN